MITTTCSAGQGIYSRSFVVVTLSQAALAPGGRETRTAASILSQNSKGNWVLSLPQRMRDSQDELEMLLARAFTGRPRCQENLELARQLTLNWCVSKCRKQGLPLEEFFGDDYQ